MKANKNSVSKTFSSILEYLINNNIKNLNLNLREKLDILRKKFEKIKNYANEKGKEINNEYHVEYSSFLEDLDKIKFGSSLERHFGIENFSKSKKEEFYDIIEVHGFLNNIKIFFKYLFKGKDIKLKDILLALKNKFVESINTEKKYFNNNYENMIKDINNEITNSFLTQSSDLSRINNEDFEKALNLFIETKMILVEEDEYKFESSDNPKIKEKNFNFEEINHLVEDKTKEENEENIFTNLIRIIIDFFDDIL